MINHARLSKLKSKSNFNVALSSEEDRYHTIFKGLELISKDINSEISQLDEKEDYILIKPNCVSPIKQLASTHVDGLKALLDYLSSLWSGKIILAEGAVMGNTFDAFHNFHYDSLKDAYPNLCFLDLNYADAVFVDVLNSGLRPFQVKLANTLIEAPLRISIGPVKTHDTVVVTLSIKNMAMGSMLKEDKERIHQGYKAINRSLAMLNEYTFPHLAILDGWESMEADGPVDGKKIETKFAVCSTNALAADVFTTTLMGFNPVQVGYLNLLGAEKVIPELKIIGKEPVSYRFHFKPHRTYLEQINWV